jgi:hypothetical protein
VLISIENFSRGLEEKWFGMGGWSSDS